MNLALLASVSEDLARLTSVDESTILYAEDEETDVFFLQRAFTKAGITHTLRAVSDGEEAVAYLSGSGPFADRELCPLPALILLDINMPRKSGFEVLEWIRRQPNLKSVPVLIFTSSSNPADKEKAGQLAADDYLVKPSDPLKLAELVKSLNERWLSQTARQLDGNGSEPGPKDRRRV